MREQLEKIKEIAEKSVIEAISADKEPFFLIIKEVESALTEEMSTRFILMEDK